MSSSSAGAGIPIAKLSVGIGVDRAQLDKVGTDVQRKLDETGEKGSKNPLMEKLLFGRGGPQGFSDTAERVVTRGLFGRMGRLVSSGGFGALGILLATRELVSLGHELFSGGEAAKEFAEKVEKGREALHDMAMEGLKARAALEKANEKWQQLLAGKDISTTLEKLERSGLHRDVIKTISEKLKGSEGEEETARKALAPLYNPDKTGKQNIEEMNAANLEKIQSNPEKYAGQLEQITASRRKAMYDQGAILPMVLQQEAEDKAKGFAPKTLAARMTQDTITSQRDVIGNAQREREIIEANARKAAELVPKTSAAASLEGGRGYRTQLTGMEEFTKKIIEIGTGKQEDNAVPREQLDVLKSIDQQLKSMGKGGRRSVVN